MNKRKITNIKNLEFKPFDKYGEPINGWSLQNISFDKKKNFGTYISKLKPVTKTRTRVHSRYKEFLILDGEIIDFGGRIFKKGNFISYKPNSSHSSFSKKRLFNFNFYERTEQSNKIK